jgi:hypothetical protein
MRSILAAVSASIIGLTGCGGGGAIGDPGLVGNPSGASGQRLAFAYFQRCVNPIFVQQLPNPNGGTANTCAAGGCHDSTTGTGGALRIIGAAQTVDLANPGNTPAVIRATDMYKNFISAQGEVVIGSPAQSFLLNKPLVRNVLHGGGQIFANDQDPNVKLVQYWISNPAPQGQDEFSTATYGMFMPADPNLGACKTN